MTGNNETAVAGPARAGDPAADEYRIARRCRICGQFLTSPLSVLAGVGPKCARGGEAR